MSSTTTAPPQGANTSPDRGELQLLPATLHVPLMNGHCEFSVHCVAVCTLQLP